jgi:hypothetical protein
MSTESIAVVAPKRKPGNPNWVKGKSGNPSGKAPGTRQVMTADAKNYLESKSLEIVRALVAKARSGDMRAIAICMDRLIPKVEIRENRDGNESLRHALAGNGTIDVVEQDKFRVVK